MRYPNSVSRKKFGKITWKKNSNNFVLLSFKIMDSLKYGRKSLKMLLFHRFYQNFKQIFDLKIVKSVKTHDFAASSCT